MDNILYTVRVGDTLEAIAERCYGDGQLWSYLADNNPLARAGFLYEGQRVEVPPLPGRTWSLADARRPALPLGHAPVKIRLDGSGPLFRHEGFGVFGLSGFVGELVFHRHGDLHLGELTASRLLGYRLEQLAWARGVFVEHFSTAVVARCDFTQPSTGPNVMQNPYHWSGPGYTITGRIGVWQVIHIHRGIVDGQAASVRTRLEMDPSAVFDSATLVLGDLPASWDAQAEKSVPIGRVLRAACPHLISPTVLWTLTRDETLLLQPPPTHTIPAPEVDWTAPLPSPSAAKRKQSPRKVGQKKAQAKKRSTTQATPRRSRKGETG
jgi:hypothetical protein